MLTLLLCMNLALTMRVAKSQDSVPQRGPGDPRNPQQLMLLLSQSGVAEELKVSAEDLRLLREIRNAVSRTNRDQERELYKVRYSPETSKDERNAALQQQLQLHRDASMIMTEELAEVLGDTEYKRLEQLALRRYVQRRGYTTVFTRGDVVKTIGIQPEQLPALEDDVRAIEKELNRQIEALHNAALRDVLARLPKDQQQRASDLFGVQPGSQSEMD